MAIALRNVCLWPKADIRSPPEPDLLSVFANSEPSTWHLAGIETSPAFVR